MRRPLASLTLICALLLGLSLLALIEAQDGTKTASAKPAKGTTKPSKATLVQSISYSGSAENPDDADNTDDAGASTSKGPSITLASGTGCGTKSPPSVPFDFTSTQFKLSNKIAPLPGTVFKKTDGTTVDPGNVAYQAILKAELKNATKVSFTCAGTNPGVNAARVITIQESFDDFPLCQVLNSINVNISKPDPFQGIVSGVVAYKGGLNWSLKSQAELDSGNATVPKTAQVCEAASVRVTEEAQATAPNTAKDPPAKAKDTKSAPKGTANPVKDNKSTAKSATGTAKDTTVVAKGAGAAADPPKGPQAFSAGTCQVVAVDGGPNYFQCAYDTPTALEATLLFQNALPVLKTFSLDQARSGQSVRTFYHDYQGLRMRVTVSPPSLKIEVVPAPSSIP